METNIIEDTKSDVPCKWLMTSEEWKAYLRLVFIESIQSHIPSRCPECHTPLEIDDEQIYCPSCGLITQDSITYTAGIKHHLPHGLRLG